MWNLEGKKGYESKRGYLGCGRGKGGGGMGIGKGMVAHTCNPCCSRSRYVEDPRSSPAWAKS
jgi:hypothetical protein